MGNLKLIKYILPNIIINTQHERCRKEVLQLDESPVKELADKEEEVVEEKEEEVEEKKDAKEEEKKSERS